MFSISVSIMHSLLCEDFATITPHPTPSPPHTHTHTCNRFDYLTGVISGVLVSNWTSKHTQCIWLNQLRSGKSAIPWHRLSSYSVILCPKQVNQAHLLRCAAWGWVLISLRTLTETRNCHQFQFHYKLRHALTGSLKAITTNSKYMTTVAIWVIIPHNQCYFKLTESALNNMLTRNIIWTSQLKKYPNIIPIYWRCVV